MAAQYRQRTFMNDRCQRERNNIDESLAPIGFVQLFTKGPSVDNLTQYVHKSFTYQFRTLGFIPKTAR